MEFKVGDKVLVLSTALSTAHDDLIGQIVKLVRKKNEDAFKGTYLQKRLPAWYVSGDIRGVITDAYYVSESEMLLANDLTKLEKVIYNIDLSKE